MNFYTLSTPQGAVGTQDSMRHDNAKTCRPKLTFEWDKTGVSATKIGGT